MKPAQPTSIYDREFVRAYDCDFDYQNSDGNQLLTFVARIIIFGVIVLGAFLPSIFFAAFAQIPFYLVAIMLVSYIALFSLLIMGCLMLSTYASLSLYSAHLRYNEQKSVNPQQGFFSWLIQDKTGLTVKEFAISVAWALIVLVATAVVLAQKWPNGISGGVLVLALAGAPVPPVTIAIITVSALLAAVCIYKMSADAFRQVKGPIELQNMAEKGADGLDKVAQVDPPKHAATVVLDGEPGQEHVGEPAFSP